MRKERAVVGLEGDIPEDGDKATTIRRPSARKINQVLGWLKQHAADPHDDGLTREQRLFARRFGRWLLAIPGTDGAAPPCPIKKREKVTLDEGDDG